MITIFPPASDMSAKVHVSWRPHSWRSVWPRRRARTPPGILSIALVVSVACFGFYAARAGQPLFGKIDMADG